MNSWWLALDLETWPDQELGTQTFTHTASLLCFPVGMCKLQVLGPGEICLEEFQDSTQEQLAMQAFLGSLLWSLKNMIS